MIVIVNGVVINTDHLRCERVTLEGHRCNACVGEMGIVEIASIPKGDGTYITKSVLTCGIHVNVDAGKIHREQIIIDAANRGSLIDQKESENK